MKALQLMMVRGPAGALRRLGAEGTEEGVRRRAGGRGWLLKGGVWGGSWEWVGGGDGDGGDMVVVGCAMALVIECGSGVARCGGFDGEEGSEERRGICRGLAVWCCVSWGWRNDRGVMANMFLTLWSIRAALLVPGQV